MDDNGGYAESVAVTPRLDEYEILGENRESGPRGQPSEAVPCVDEDCDVSLEVHGREIGGAVFTYVVPSWSDAAPAGFRGYSVYSGEADLVGGGGGGGACRRDSDGDDDDDDTQTVVPDGYDEAVVLGLEEGERE